MQIVNALYRNKQCLQLHGKFCLWSLMVAINVSVAFCQLASCKFWKNVYRLTVVVTEDAKVIRLGAQVRLQLKLIQLTMLIPTVEIYSYNKILIISGKTFVFHFHLNPAQSPPILVKAKVYGLSKRTHI